MKSFIDGIRTHIPAALNSLLNHTIFNTLNLFTPTTANLSHVDRIRNDLRNGGVRPQLSMSCRNSMVVQIVSDNFCTLVIDIHFINFLNNWSFIRVGFQGISFFIGKLYSTVSIRGNAVNPLSLRCTALTTSDQSAVDGFILSPAHEQAKLKVFFIELVGGIINFRRSNYFCPRKLKHLTNICLVGTVTSCQSLHIYNQNTGINSSTDFL